MHIWKTIKTKWKSYLFRRRAKTAEIEFPVICKLHGVKKLGFQGALLQSRAGDELQLVHTPTAQNPDLVYAYSVSLNRILGCLHEALAEKLIYVFGKGFCKDGEIEKITGEAYETLGCNIRIFATANALKDESDFSHLYEN